MREEVRLVATQARVFLWASMQVKSYKPISQRLKSSSGLISQPVILLSAPFPSGCVLRAEQTKASIFRFFSESRSPFHEHSVVGRALCQSAGSTSRAAEG